jgi:hypothetical protein
LERSFAQIKKMSTFEHRAIGSSNHDRVACCEHQARRIAHTSSPRENRSRNPLLREQDVPRIFGNLLGAGGYPMGAEQNGRAAFLFDRRRRLGRWGNL